MNRAPAPPLRPPGLGTAAFARPPRGSAWEAVLDQPRPGWLREPRPHARQTRHPGRRTAFCGRSRSPSAGLAGASRAGHAPRSTACGSTPVGTGAGSSGRSALPAEPDDREIARLDRLARAGEVSRLQAAMILPACGSGAGQVGARRTARQVSASALGGSTGSYTDGTLDDTLLLKSDRTAAVQG